MFIERKKGKGYTIVYKHVNLCIISIMHYGSVSIRHQATAILRAVSLMIAKMTTLITHFIE